MRQEGRIDVNPADARGVGVVVRWNRPGQPAMEGYFSRSPARARELAEQLQ